MESIKQNVRYIPRRCLRSTVSCWGPCTWRGWCWCGGCWWWWWCRCAGSAARPAHCHCLSLGDCSADCWPGPEWPYWHHHHPPARILISRSHTPPPGPLPTDSHQPVVLSPISNPLLLLSTLSSQSTQHRSSFLLDLLALFLVGKWKAASIYYDKLLLK